MHLFEINIFSLNIDLVTLTKIMNNLVKDLKILSFKVIFQCLKLVEAFKKKFCERYLIMRPILTKFNALIQMKLTLLCVWAERAVLGCAKTALKVKFEIQIG